MPTEQLLLEIVLIFTCTNFHTCQIGIAILVFAHRVQNNSPQTDKIVCSEDSNITVSSLFAIKE